jgi:Spy/CpxP family protein refolding chaperone
MRNKIALALFVALAYCVGWGSSGAAAPQGNQAGIKEVLRQSEQPQRPARPLRQVLPPARRQELKRAAVGQFTEDEIRMVPRGIVRPDAMIRTFRRLDLSDEQRAKLRELARHYGNRLPALNQLQMAQNLALEEAIYSPDFDPQVVEQKVNELAATQTERLKLQTRIMLELRQILTPEQVLKFREYLEEERRNPPH